MEVIDVDALDASAQKRSSIREKKARRAAQNRQKVQFVDNERRLIVDSNTTPDRQPANLRNSAPSDIQDSEPMGSGLETGMLTGQDNSQ